MSIERYCDETTVNENTRLVAGWNVGVDHGYPRDMFRFAHVIVEQQDGHWSAWFRGTPQVACGAATPVAAVEDGWKADVWDLSFTRIEGP